MTVNAKITHIVIDEQMLEEAAKRSKGTAWAVNEKARRIRDACNKMARGFETPMFYGDRNSPAGIFTGNRGKVKESWLRDKSGVELYGKKHPIYLYIPSKSRTNPYALVYTSNYAAMKFEHEHNAMLKASR